LRKGHTGQYLAEKLFECLESYGISKKVICTYQTSGYVYCLTADNASNNNTMIRALEPMLDCAAGSHTRIRCL
ncbi:hypothetical protein OH76DRAFT_1305396, partial [Lentinus brumalis]